MMISLMVLFCVMLSKPYRMNLMSLTFSSDNLHNRFFNVVDFSGDVLIS